VKDFWQNANIPNVTKWPLSVPYRQLLSATQLMADTQLQQGRCSWIIQNLNFSIFCDSLSTGQHVPAQTESGDRQRNSTIAFREYVSGIWKCTRIRNKVKGKNVTTVEWQPGLFIQMLVTLIYWHVLDHVPGGLKHPLPLFFYCGYSHCCIEGCLSCFSQNESHNSCIVHPKT